MNKHLEFAIRSPLLADKAQKHRDACIANLAPVRAVFRCAGPRACHNVELESHMLVEPGVELKFWQVSQVPKSIAFSVELQILRNVSSINTGDILLLPLKAMDVCAR